MDRRPRRRPNRPQPPRADLPSPAGPLDQRPSPGRATAILTNLAEAELPVSDLEPFYEARQTIEGWLSEATAALQLKGLWSRAFAGLEAFLLHAALASNLLNWWERRVLLPDAGLPHLGLRQLIDRVIALPPRILQAADGRLTLLLPPTHPYARHLAPPARPGSSRCRSSTSSSAMRISDA